MQCINGRPEHIFAQGVRLFAAASTLSEVCKIHHVMGNFYPNSGHDSDSSGLRADTESLLANGTLLGSLFENFVLMELVKMADWSENRLKLYHWRTPKRREVDLIVEGPDGLVAGIEVKAASVLKPMDFSHLKALAQMTGDRFHRGIILYTGERVLSFGPGLFAVPVSALWRT